jgi:carboxyl-terminal processing protease
LTRLPRSIAVFLTLLLLSGLLLPATGAQAASCEPDGPESEGLGLVHQAYEVLGRSYVDPVSSDQLLGSAAHVVRGVLSESSVLEADPPHLGQVLTSYDDWSDFETEYCARWLKYGERVNERALAYVAIQAMVDALDEPHTNFIPARLNQGRSEQAEGSRFVGLGVELLSDPLRIITIFYGSPAAEAGLQADDRILAIDGRTTLGIPMTEITAQLRGDPETPVELLIARPGESETHEVEVVRRSMRLPPVRSRMYDGVGYLSIRTFSDRSLSEHLERELAWFNAQGVQGLVLDLRGNPGGLGLVGAQAGGLLLPAGSELMTEVNRSGRRTSRFVVGQQQWTGPLVVLVDRGSASMSEILAAALQEHGVPIVGQRTAGAVAGSQFFPLGDGSALQVTISHVETPGGRDLNRLGVEPDMALPRVRGEQPPSGQDLQLDAALQLVHEIAREGGR